MERKEEMDMATAVEGLISLFVNMDGDSRVMFISILVTKMKDDEVDLILEVIDQRQRSNNGESNGDILRCWDIQVHEEILEKELEEDSNDNNYQVVNTEIQHMEEIGINNFVKAEMTDPLPEDENKIFDKSVTKKTFACINCSKIFSSKRSLRSPHERYHETHHETYDCKQCGKVYRSKNSLAVHVGIVHREPANCSVCNKSFTQEK